VLPYAGYSATDSGDPATPPPLAYPTASSPTPYADSPYASPTPYDTPTQYGTPTPGTDGVSVAALVTGILQLGVVPLVLGIVGLRRVKRSGRSGKGMAIAGIVLGALSTLGWTVLLVVIIALAGSDEFRDGVRSGFEDAAEAAAMDVGQCLDIPGDPADIDTADDADCATEHVAEVIATEDLTTTSFPGDDAVSAEADEYCGGAFPDYIGSEYEDSSLDLYYGLPTAGTWVFGDRQIVCYVVASDGSQLTGSIADSGR
jgi:hypothetical protein